MAWDGAVWETWWSQSKSWLDFIVKGEHIISVTQVKTEQKYHKTDKQKNKKNQNHMVVEKTGFLNKPSNRVWQKAIAPT